MTEVIPSTPLIVGGLNVLSVSQPTRLRSRAAAFGVYIHDDLAERGEHLSSQFGRDPLALAQRTRSGALHDIHRAHAT